MFIGSNTGRSLEVAMDYQWLRIVQDTGVSRVQSTTRDRSC